MAEGYRPAPPRPKTASGEPETARALPLTRAAAEWARITGAPRPHRATLARWCVRGCRGVRLRGELAGGAWYVTREALVDFHRRLNEPRPEAADRVAGPARAAEIERTIAELHALVGWRPTT
jgi:hypothetical protein